MIFNWFKKINFPHIFKYIEIMLKNNYLINIIFYLWFWPMLIDVDIK
jgi:hypothetical protein